MQRLECGIHGFQNRHFTQVWMVTSSSTNWALCSCYLGLCENICKHAIKVFKLINTNVRKRAIIQYVGTSRGTITRRYDARSMDTYALETLVQVKMFKDTSFNDKTWISSKVDDLQKIITAMKSILANLESLAMENPSLHAHILTYLTMAKQKVLDFWPNLLQDCCILLSNPPLKFV